MNRLSIPEQGTAQSRLIGFALLGVSILYLIIELAFNAHLVGLSGSGATIGNLERAETIGRTVAGFGAALIAFRAFMYGDRARRLIRGSLTAALAVSAGVGTSVWFSQKALIDHLVAQADPETRQVAAAVVLMKASLRTGDLSLNGYVLRANDPGAKTFLGTLGLFAFSSPDVVASVRSNADTFAAAAVQNRIDTDRAHQAYADAARDVRRGYEAYQTVSRHLSDARQQPEVVAAQMWTQVENELADMAESAQAARLAFIQAVSGAENTHRMLSRYFGDPARYQAEYDEMTRTLTAGEEVDPQEWCAGACPGSVDHVKRVTGRLGREGLARLGISVSGEVLSLADSPRAQELIVAAVQERGLALPPDWADRANRPRDAFILSLTPLLPLWAEQEYASSVFSSIPAGLSLEAFAQEMGVTDRMRSQLGLSAGDDFSWAWSREEFDSALWAARGQGQAGLLAESVRVDDTTLSDAVIKQVSDDAVRAAAIPPIAMAFSLFFGLTNLSSLLLKLPIFSIFGLNEGRAAMIMRASILSALLIVPLLLPWRGDVLLTAPLDGSPSSLLGHWLNIMVPALYPLTSTLEVIPVSLGLWDRVA